MLFTDGTISTISDLLDYETAILDVASTEHIDLVTKLGLARQEIGLEVAAFLQQQEGVNTVLPKPELKHVVVTEALGKWHVFHALALVYRDAYNSQLNDRYEGKWKEYKALATWAAALLFKLGVGAVTNPIARAGLPALSTAPGTAAAATYFARATWVSGSEEGGPSEMVVLTAEDSNVLVAGLADPPANATGWNLYAGYTESATTLQNDTPVAVGATWTAPGSALRQGLPAGTGQAPQYYFRSRRTGPARLLERG